MNQEWWFISNFHSQYRDVEAIFKRHWHVLGIDKTPNQVLPNNPSFIYRKAPSCGDKVVKEVLDPPTRPQMPWDRAGFFACRKCKACRQMRNPIRGLVKFRSTANNKEFEVTEFISCNTTHVIYALECPSGMMYIGRTKRPLKKHMAEHIHNIKIGFKHHSVSSHFKHHHNREPSGLKFWGLDRTYPAWRGVNSKGII